MLEKLLIKNLNNLGYKISTMESCTGGHLISVITNEEGSSNITEGGYVTYSNEAKVRMGVSADIINEYGVYSYETAEAMAKACKDFNECEVGVGVTGTFSNQDETNSDSVALTAYYAIAIKEDIFRFKESIPMANREAQKSYLVNKILHSLNDVFFTLNSKNRV